MRISALIIAVLLGAGHSFAASEFEEETPQSGRPVVHSFSVSAGPEYVASSISDDVMEVIDADKKIRVNSAFPLSLKYAFSLNNPAISHYLPGGYQGIALGVLNFGAVQPHGFGRATHNIGYPVLAYIFQGGPFHHFSQKLSLNYEWNFGAAFGWKPYSDSNRNFNLTVGSKVNAYLNLGLMLNWQLTRHCSLFGGLIVSHFSNGNTSFPNPGVNTFGLRLGMQYTLNPPAKGFLPPLPSVEKKRKVEYDLLGWGAWRKRVYRGGEKPVLLSGHFACAGISFAPMYRFNTWWRAGGSLDLQWDQSSDMKKNYIEGSTTDDIRFHTPSFWRQLTVGISAHGELQMPIFAVNVGCGYNLVAPWENKGFYQNISLKTYIGENFFINIGYQLRNFRQQSSLMLGAGVTI